MNGIEGFWPEKRGYEEESVIGTMSSSKRQALGVSSSIPWASLSFGVQGGEEESVFISFGGNNNTDTVSFDHSHKKNNNFPANVRALMSTGILDGVPVKYIAWSREKQLPAIIKGSGYLCGCHSCNYSHAINAYELERHAGCKTKHPNNHIYFDNCKTIYAAVQQLKSTPRNLLFDAIRSVAGSPINLHAFRLWKASFLDANCQPNHIYEDVKPL